MVFELIRSAEASASLHSRICFQNLYAPSVSHPNLNLCIHNTIIDSGVQPVQAIDQHTYRWWHSELLHHEGSIGFSNEKVNFCSFFECEGRRTRWRSEIYRRDFYETFAMYVLQV